MKHLNLIYSKLNEVLDTFDIATHQLNIESEKAIRTILSDKKSYTENISDKEISIVVDTYVNMTETIISNEKCKFVDHASSASFVLDALFFLPDFQPLDLLRSSRPFCLLSSDAANEIKGIVKLNAMVDTNENNFFGIDIYSFCQEFNLQTRKMKYDLSRKENGLKE